MRRFISPQMSQEYQQRLTSDKLNEFKAGPVQNRSCTDIVCVILFVLTVLLYIVFTVYFIINGAGTFSQLTKQDSIKKGQSDFGATFVKVVGINVGMIALSLVLSVIFVFLCAKFPKCVVYTGIVVTFIVYAGLIILAIIAKIWVVAVVTIVVALLNACLLYCYRQQIKTGIVLLGLSGNFMTQKPSVVLIGVICLVLNIIFEIVFIVGWISAYSQTLPENNSDESLRNRFNNMMYFYFFMTIYFGYFLYYLMVFAVSTSVAYWYYQQQKNVLYGFKAVNKHVGSLALASLIITIITILRRLASQKANQSSGALGIVFCIIACIIRCIEGFVEVLNHYSIITMSVAGENFINSAKTTITLILGNFGLYYIVDFISNFIQFYALVVCVLIPSFIGGGLIWQSQKVQSTAVIGGITIFFLAWIISSVILGILYEVLASIFIMFCLDKRMRSQGIVAGNIPPEMKQLFNQAVNQKGSYGISHQNQRHGPKPSTSTNLNNQQKQMGNNPYAYQSNVNNNAYQNHAPMQNGPNNGHPYYEQPRY